MARIRKEDHPRILRMIEVEHRKVPDIAAEFGCSAANIYAVVTKLRRQTAERAQEERPAQAPLALEEEQPAELIALPVGETQTPADVAPERTVVAFERADPPANPASEAKLPRKPVAPDTNVDMRQRRGGGRPLGAKLAKPGVGLVMRTADGEETLTPFRSLDDLLSAVKPILRATARSSEPVWFSLQPVDLSTIDVDAA